MLKAILSILCAADNGIDLVTITTYVRGYWIRMVKQEDVAEQLDLLVSAGVLMRHGNRFQFVDRLSAPTPKTHVDINAALTDFVDTHSEKPPTMKRYALFVMSGYYPRGGMNDFLCDGKSIDDLVVALGMYLNRRKSPNLMPVRKGKSITYEDSTDAWAEIWDTVEVKKVWSIDDLDKIKNA